MVVCPLCQGRVRTLTENLVGYRDDLRFTVVECISCGLSRALPAAADSVLYQWIYDHADRVPGYARYDAYRRQVKSETRPLDYLTSREDAYWACAEYLQAYCSRVSRKPRILEVGCGAGYFTYALRQAGYNTTGCDISTSAVLKARDTFGPFYEVMDIQSSSLCGTVRYDVLVMLELIEHVENPVEFLRSAQRLLSPTGEMFLTTPNKGAFGRSGLWDTDLPPIHLYWFTARSLDVLATHLGCEVHSWDFSARYERRYLPKTAFQGVNRSPTFSADGKLLVPAPVHPCEQSPARCWAQSLADATGFTSCYRKFRDALTGRERWSGSVGPTLAVWLKPKAL